MNEETSNEYLYVKFAINLVCKNDALKIKELFENNKITIIGNKVFNNTEYVGVLHNKIANIYPKKCL